MSAAAVVVPVATEVAGRATGLVQAGERRTRDALEGRGSTGWAIVGYALGLILLYVLIADSRVVKATTKLVGGAQTATEAWIKPVDPLALLGERFGYTPSTPGPGSEAPSGSSPAGVRSKLGAGTGYVSPFSAKATAGRTDQGVDFSAPPGSSVLAIGRAKIMGIEQNWYRGQPFIYYKLLDGPRAGQYVYAAEQIQPTVRVGQIVPAGQPIGRVARSGTGLELGFATANGATLAHSTTGYVEGRATAAGDAFRSFLGL